MLFIGLGAILFGLLYATAFLPRARIQGHIAQDRQKIVSRGQHPIEKFAGSQVILDGLSDAFMMSESLTHYPGYTPLKQIILSPTLTASHDPGTETKLLNKQVMGQPVPLVNYTRYWHGYLVTLRPALTLFSYSTVVKLNIVISLLLMLGAAIAFRKVSGWVGAVTFVFSLLLVGYWATVFNFQTSTMFLISFIGVITAALLLKHKEMTRWDYLLFLSLGIGTAFFDFLTIPLLSLCLPALYLIAAALKKGTPLRVRRIFLWFVCWGIGYVCFWAIKWIMVAALQGPAALKSILSQVTYRAGSSGAQGLTGSLRLTGIMRNIKWFSYNLVGTGKSLPLLALAAVVIAGFIITLVYMLFTKKTDLRTRLRSFFVIWAFAAVPFFWYMFALNHSVANALFTYRLLFVSIFATCLFWILFLKQKEKLSHVIKSRDDDN
ncbi:MAG: hypothetical protein FWF45_03690 [Coriobacteriia bacterium]|nr:hypothetical protein [Coriobacteriia bacterium]